MDLRQLGYFARVAQVLSFSQAANTLGVAQLALSRQIAALEEELNLRLFIRTGRGVALTAQGEADIRTVVDIVRLTGASPFSTILRIVGVWTSLPQTWVNTHEWNAQTYLIRHGTGARLTKRERLSRPYEGNLKYFQRTQASNEPNEHRCYHGVPNFKREKSCEH